MHSDGVVVRVIENEDKVLVCDDAYPLKVDVSDERIMVLESICFEWKRFFAEKLSVDSAFRDVLNNADLFNASSEEVEVARRKRVDDEKSKFLNAVSKKCVDRCYLRMKGDLGLLLVPLGISDVDMEWAYAHLESRVAFHLNEVKDGIVVARRLEHEKNGGGAVHNRGLFADKGAQHSSQHPSRLSSHKKSQRCRPPSPSRTATALISRAAPPIPIRDIIP